MDVTFKSEKVIPNQLYFQEVIRLLDEDRQVRIPVKGTSMQPFLKDGDSVVLLRFTGGPVFLGAVVLGRYRDGVVLHRVVSVQQTTVKLAGDGNLVQRETISLDDILAVAISRTSENELTSLATSRSRLSGLAWYYLRPVRRVYCKLRRLVKA